MLLFTPKSKSSLGVWLAINPPPPINTQHKHKALKIAFLKLSSMTLSLLLKNLDFIIIKY
ncbi:hypothetical protein EC515_00630 [Helicobacter pylori]|nr:hypothetical protein EC515_00630 [Helicobacter pylori]